MARNRKNIPKPEYAIAGKANARTPKKAKGEIIDAALKNKLELACILHPAVITGLEKLRHGQKNQPSTGMVNVATIAPVFVLKKVPATMPDPIRKRTPGAML